MNSKQLIRALAVAFALGLMVVYVVFILTRMARSPGAQTNLAVLAIALGVGTLAAVAGGARRRRRRSR